MYEYLKKSLPSCSVAATADNPQKQSKCEKTNQEEMLNTLYGKEQQLTKMK
jgi:hypothetical protein